MKTNSLRFDGVYYASYNSGGLIRCLLKFMPNGGVEEFREGGYGFSSPKGSKWIKNGEYVGMSSPSISTWMVVSDHDLVFLEDSQFMKFNFMKSTPPVLSMAYSNKLNNGRAKTTIVFNTQDTVFLNGEKFSCAHTVDDHGFWTVQGTITDQIRGLKTEKFRYSSVYFLCFGPCLYWKEDNCFLTGEF